jgi:hypothetical protein
VLRNIDEGGGRSVRSFEKYWLVFVSVGGDNDIGDGVLLAVYELFWLSMMNGGIWNGRSNSNYTDVYSVFYRRIYLFRTAFSDNYGENRLFFVA